MKRLKMLSLLLICPMLFSCNDKIKRNTVNLTLDNYLVYLHTTINNNEGTITFEPSFPSSIQYMFIDTTIKAGLNNTTEYDKESLLPMKGTGTMKLGVSGGITIVIKSISGRVEYFF